MLSDEEVRQHRLAADGCNLNGCSHVEALLTDRAELVAENERLREQTQKWVKDWEVECQRYEAALGMTTSEHVALKDEIERLREQCVRWEAMYAGMTAERDGYWEECDSFKAENERLRAVVEAARELMAARGPHIEGSVPLKNALAALEGDSHA